MSDTGRDSRLLRISVSIVTILSGLSGILFAYLNYYHASNENTKINQVSTGKNSSVFSVSGVNSSIIQNNTLNSIINNQADRPPAGSKEDAIKQLRDRGFAFSILDFDKAARSEGPDVMRLFMQGGMSPNSISPRTPGFISDAIVHDNKAFMSDDLAVLKSFGLDFKKTLPSLKKIYFPAENANMEEQLFEGATSNDVAILIRLGASPVDFVDELQRLCALYKNEEAKADDLVVQSRRGASHRQFDGSIVGRFNRQIQQSSAVSLLDQANDEFESLRPKFQEVEQQLETIAAGGGANSGCHPLGSLDRLRR